MTIGIAALALVVGVALTVLANWLLASPAPPRPVRFAIVPPAAQRLSMA